MPHTSHNYHLINIFVLRFDSLPARIRSLCCRQILLPLKTSLSGPAETRIPSTSDSFVANSHFALHPFTPLAQAWLLLIDRVPA